MNAQDETFCGFFKFERDDFGDISGGITDYLVI